MKKTKFAVALTVVTIVLAALAWVPSNTQFDPRYFSTNGFLISLKTGSLPAGGQSTNIITVSPYGIKNNGSPLVNDGAAFGPDTPGTATSGIQEALNSIPVKLGYGTNTTGAKVILALGDFYYTNSIVYSNTFVYNVDMEGASMLGSRVIYAGNETNAAGFTFIGGGNANISSLEANVHVNIHNLTFTAIRDELPFFNLVITNDSDFVVEDCNFTGRGVTTNVIDGPETSIQVMPDAVPGNIGMLVGRGNDHAGWVSRCFFSGLAAGIVTRCDHMHIVTPKFAIVGQSVNGGDAANWSVNSVYSLGACILVTGGLDVHIERPHFYSSMTGVAIDQVANDSGNQGSGPPVYITDPVFEGADFSIACSSTNQVIWFTGTDSNNGEITGAAGSIGPIAFIKHLGPGNQLIHTNRAVFKNLRFATYGGGGSNPNVLVGGGTDTILRSDVVPGPALILSNSTLLTSSTTFDTNFIYVSGAGTTAANGKYKWKNASAAYVAWTNDNLYGILLDVSLGVNTDAYEITNPAGTHIYGVDGSRPDIWTPLFNKFPARSADGTVSLWENLGGGVNPAPTNSFWGTNQAVSTGITADSPYLLGPQIILPNLTQPKLLLGLPPQSLSLWNSNEFLYVIDTGTTPSNLRSTNQVFVLGKSGVLTNFIATSAGTVFQFSGTSYGLLDFGTTDPAITIQNTGNYLITGKANFVARGATYGATNTYSIKLRRTSGTPADLTGSEAVNTIPIITTISEDLGIIDTRPVIYSATAGDVIQLWGILSATPSAGNVICDRADIVAIRIY